MMINTTEILNLIEKGNLTDVSSKTEIDVLGLEVNELQDYIDIAEENDFF